MSPPVTDEVTAYIGLGGNVGDVVDNFRQALQALNQHQRVRVDLVSPVYKTPPWGVEDQPWFHNACAKLTTSLAAEELLDACLRSEKALKRVRDIRWGPRTIDLDILILSDEQIKSERLTIPHPRITERQFVLQPLADIAPKVVIEGKAAEDWLLEKAWPDLETVPLEKNWWATEA